MQLVLYKNTSRNDVINKVLTDGTVFNINLKRETDIINPELYLVNLTGIDYADFNYAEIVELNRFYFINSVTSVNASLFRLNCSTDVLETYRGIILNSDAEYKSRISAGDYGAIDVTGTGNKIKDVFMGDFEFIKSDNSILSVLR